jgi:hypothetical protein
MNDINTRSSLSNNLKRLGVSFCSKLADGHILPLNDTTEFNSFSNLRLESKITFKTYVGIIAIG